MKRKQVFAFLVAWFFGAVCCGQSVAAPPAVDSHLLGFTRVRRELKISHAISVRILDLLNEAARLNQGGVMTRERATQLTAERHKTDPDVLQRRAGALLTPVQRQRLEQLNLQQAAPFVVNDARVAARLGVSPQQVQEIQSAQKREFDRHQKQLEPLRRAHFARFERASASEKALRQQKMDRLGTTYLQRCRAALLRVLTPAQEARWRALFGKPFDFRALRSDVRGYPMD